MYLLTDFFCIMIIALFWSAISWCLVRSKTGAIEVRANQPKYWWYIWDCYTGLLLLRYLKCPVLSIQIHAYLCMLILSSPPLVTSTIDWRHFYTLCLVCLKHRSASATCSTSTDTLQTCLDGSASPDQPRTSRSPRSHGGGNGGGGSGQNSPKQMESDYMSGDYIEYLVNQSIRAIYRCSIKSEVRYTEVRYTKVLLYVKCLND